MVHEFTLLGEPAELLEADGVDVDKSGSVVGAQAAVLIHADQVLVVQRHLATPAEDKDWNVIKSC